MVNIRRKPKPEKSALCLAIKRATSPPYSSEKNTEKRLKEKLEELGVE